MTMTSLRKAQEDEVEDAGGYASPEWSMLQH